MSAGQKAAKARATTAAKAEAKKRSHGSDELIRLSREDGRRRCQRRQDLRDLRRAYGTVEAIARRHGPLHRTDPKCVTEIRAEFSELWGLCERELYDSRAELGDVRTVVEPVPPHPFRVVRGGDS